MLFYVFEQVFLFSLMACELVFFFYNIMNFFLVSSSLQFLIFRKKKTL